jgi:hypothetical protein
VPAAQSTVPVAHKLSDHQNALGRRMIDKIKTSKPLTSISSAHISALKEKKKTLQLNMDKARPSLTAKLLNDKPESVSFRGRFKDPQMV